jgi:hypothetical protein
MNDLRMNIKSILLDESLPPDNMSARSATEVIERMKQLSQNLGSAFGRLINETMVPLVEKILQIMDDRGIIDLPLKVNGLEIKVTPISPLAMSQNMDDVQNIMQYLQITQQAGPEGQFALKTDMLLDLIADKMAIPQSVRNSPAERDMMKQEAMQMAQQAAQVNPEMAAQVAGEAMKGAM